MVITDLFLIFCFFVFFFFFFFFFWFFFPSNTVTKQPFLFMFHATFKIIFLLFKIKVYLFV